MRTDTSEGLYGRIVLPYEQEFLVSDPEHFW